MRLLVDSSTIYSAIVYTGEVMDLFDILVEKHTIVLTDYIIGELKRNFKEKLSSRNRNKALRQLNFLISNCEIKKKNEYVHNLSLAQEIISDKDAPIIACGMLPDIDYLISSDKEFWKLKSKKIIILPPSNARKKLL